MYAVIKYNDSSTGNYFQILDTTDSLDDSEKLAFNHAKKIAIKNTQNTKETDFTIHKITTDINHQYVFLENKIIIGFRVIGLEYYDKKWSLQYYSSEIFSVIELPKNYFKEIEDIDESMIYNEEEEEKYDDDDEYKNYEDYYY